MADAINTTKRKLLKGLGALPLLAASPLPGEVRAADDMDRASVRAFALSAMMAVTEMARGNHAALSRLEAATLEQVLTAGFACGALDGTDCRDVLVLSRTEVM